MACYVRHLRLFSGLEKQEGSSGTYDQQVRLNGVDAYIRENTTEVIDPLESQKKMQELKEKIDTLLTELDTQIKVSNATTTIEF